MSIKASHKDIKDCFKFLASSSKLKSASFEEICAHVVKVKMFLRNGFDVDYKTSGDKTLLHIVLSKGMMHYNKKALEKFNENPTLNVDFAPLDIKYLTTKYRPNPFIRDEQGLTPSMKALDKGLKNEFHWLISYENAYQSENQAKALQALAILAELVPHNIEDKDPYRKTVIRRAQKTFNLSMQNLAGENQNNG